MHHRAMPAVSIAASILLLAVCQTPADATVSLLAVAASATPSRAPADSEIAPSPGATAGQSLGISSIVSLRAIGSTRAFLERTLGEPTYETPGSAHYTAGGCNVTVSFGEDEAVSMVSIAIEGGCRFDASRLAAGTPAVIDGTLTFARFEQMFGAARYSSPCLASCGNADDSYVDAVVSGYRANGMIDIGAQTLFVDDDAIDASAEWRDRLAAQMGEDFVLDGRFNCVAGHDRIPRAAFAHVRVESLWFGQPPGTDDCS